MRLAGVVAWCFVSGLAVSVTFPSQDLRWLSWVALVPLLVAIQGVSWSRALLLTLVFACGLAAPLGAWIPDVVMGGFQARPLGAYGLWAIASLSYVPAILVLGLGLSRISHRSALYPWAAGLGWTLVELSYRDLWPRVPWLVLGAPQIDTPVALLAAMVGVHGVSALVVVVNALLAQVVGRASPVSLSIGASLVTCMAAVVVVLVPGESAEERTGTPLRVAIIQPAVPMPGRADLRFQHENMQALFELSRGVEDADLVIWPENSLTSTLEGRADLAKVVPWTPFSQQMEPPENPGRFSSDGPLYGASRYGPAAL